MDLRQPGAIAGGISLAVVGGWLLADLLGARIASFSAVWPGVLILLGLTMLVQFLGASQHSVGLAFIGLGILLLGSFLCVFTIQLGGLAWQSMTEYWPTFLIIIGATFTGVYMFDNMRHDSLLVPAYLIGGLGLILLPITMHIVPGPLFTQIIQISPVPIALALLVFFFRPPRKTPPSD